MRAWSIPAFGLDNLQLVERPDSEPGPGQVVIAVRAVSLNYRDLMIARGQYNPRMALPRVPCSDAAGEVVAVGPGVTRVAVGDRVYGTFMQDWATGPLTDSAAKSALGGDRDGVLAERICLSEFGVVKIPAHIRFEEAATLRVPRSLPGMPWLRGACGQVSPCCSRGPAGSRSSPSRSRSCSGPAY